MVAQERETLGSLYAVYRLFESYSDDFKRLMQRVPNGWRDFRMVQTKIFSMLKKSIETVPADQERVIKHHVELNRIHVGVEDVGVRPKDLWVMSYDDIGVLAEHAVKTTCFMCNKTGKCELRNVLKNLPLGGVNTALVRCWEGE